MKRADVVVVGAGPSGLAAAAVTGAVGLATLVLDEQPRPGGQIWRAAEAVAADPARRDLFGKSFDGATDAIAGARARATLAAGAEVVDISPEREVLWFDRAEGRLRETAARTILLATGAMERPVPFPGWTLPGVTGVGALQIALKQGGLWPEGPIVLAGQGPLLLLFADQLRTAGAQIAAMLDFGGALPSREALSLLPGAFAADPGLLTEGARLAVRRSFGTTLHRRVEALRANGADRLETVTFRADGVEHEIAAAHLAVHDGVVPNTQLARLLGLAHRWDEGIAAFVPVVDAECNGSLPGIFLAGDGAGIRGAALARRQGAEAGRAICRALGAGRDGAAPSPDGRARARPFIEALYPPRPVSQFADGDTPLCRCESVTFAMVRRAVSLGADGPNRAKTATRCGMGPCQGRICGGNLTRLIAEETGRTPGDVGALRIRPPLKPILLADYAALAGAGGPDE